LLRVEDTRRCGGGRRDTTILSSRAKAAKPPKSRDLLFTAKKQIPPLVQSAAQ
jgi:hypothetical protein